MGQEMIIFSAPQGVPVGQDHLFCPTASPFSAPQALPVGQEMITFSVPQGVPVGQEMIIFSAPEGPPPRYHNKHKTL